MSESEIFNVVRKLPIDQREDYLRRACGGNGRLRQRIQELLQTHEEIDATLDSDAKQQSNEVNMVGSGPELEPTSDLADEDPQGADSPQTVTFDAEQAHQNNSKASDHQIRPGDRIGPFRLLQALGKGGMGEVWMAEQSEPVKRRVALKVIKRGIASKEILTRFEAERQALAMMNHPNIARILDAGTTPDGQPYFAMELVQGEPLTTYCDQNKLSIDDRLNLFIDVCSGVQHAHQKGIIHRDLKPGNILVSVIDGKAVAKVIDFGLAKAMESTQRLTDQSLFTGIGQILGTLRYMSPEQASLDVIDIDTRTDIYALGVILYELLTGSTPLDDSSIKGHAALKILEFIRDEEPVKPSSKLSSSTEEQISTITGHRKTDSGRLNYILAGDLDWIVMKALEKDRTRRYESASGFAADVRRYLNSEPVIARPPSMNYRVRKFVRKNRVGVIAASLVALTLLGGILGTSVAMFRALTAEALAETRLTEAIQAREREKEQRLLAEDRRQEAVQNLAYAKKGNAILGSVFSALNPKAEYHTVSELRNALGDNLEKAIEELEVVAIGNPLDVAEMQMILGNSLLGLGQAEKAVLLFERLEKYLTSTFGNDHPDTLTCVSNLAACYLAAGRADDSLPLLERTLELRKTKLGPDHPETLNSFSNLASTYLAAGDIEKALLLYENSLVDHREKLGEDHPLTLTIMNNLAAAYQVSGEYEKALSLLEKTLELRQVKLGPSHPDTLFSMSNLAEIYRVTGQHDKLLPILEQTYELRRSKLGAEHPDTLTSLHNLGGGLLAVGQFDKSLPILEKAFELRQAKLGLNHPQTLSSMGSLAEGYRQAGQLEKSLVLSEKSFELMKAKLGADHPDTLDRMNTLAVVHFNTGQFDKALFLLEETVNLRKAKSGADHPATLTAMANLAYSYHTTGQLDRALPLMEQTLELRKSTLGHDHPDTLSGMSNLAFFYLTANQLDPALSLFEQTLKLQKSKLGPDHPNTLVTMANLAKGYQDNAQHDKALPLHAQALELMRGKFGFDHPDTLTCLNNLASCYHAARQLDKALPLYEQVLGLKEDKLGRNHLDTQIALANLGVFLKEAGQIEEAIPLLEEAYQSSKIHSRLVPIRDQLTDAYVLAKRYDAFQALTTDLIATTRAQHPASSLELAAILGQAADGYLRLSLFGEAAELLREGVLIRNEQAPDAWITFNTQSMLGGALLGLARSLEDGREKAFLLTEIEHSLVSGYEGMKQRESAIPPQAANCIPDALDRLVELYTALENPDEAQKYRDLRASYPPAAENLD